MFDNVQKESVIMILRQAQILFPKYNQQTQQQLIKDIEEIFSNFSRLGEITQVHNQQYLKKQKQIIKYFISQVINTNQEFQILKLEMVKELNNEYTKYIQSNTYKEKFELVMQNSQDQVQKVFCDKEFIYDRVQELLIYTKNSIIQLYEQGHKDGVDKLYEKAEELILKHILPEK